MTSPVRCTHCGKIYDLSTVEITQRYADCSMWNSPCCNILVDDRSETGWKSYQGYVRISSAEANRAKVIYSEIDMYGNDLFYCDALGQTRN